MLDYLLFATAGILLAAASLLSESWAGLACALGTAVLYGRLAPRTAAPRKGFFLSGAVFTAIAFYWLPATLQLFGGMPYAAALLVFVLFCLTSALQFLLAGFICRRVQLAFPALAPLALAGAWLTAELAFPRLFPWAIGHALIPWTSIAALAEFVGVPLLSALMLVWGSWAAALCDREQRSSSRLFLISVPVLTIIVMLVGRARTQQILSIEEAAPALKIAAIQGNLNVFQKRDINYLQANVETYKKLSIDAYQEGAELLIWPETVVSRWIEDTVHTLAGTSVDPRSDEAPAPLLFGSLSFHKRTADELAALFREHPELRSREFQPLVSSLRYNSAIGIDQEGRVIGRYHKRVLMPFGEYVPFSDWFPSLKLLLPMTGDFAAGALVEPIVFTLPPSVVDSAPREVRIAALICYEDLVPALAGEAVKRSANLLVNLTNDAWYGDTAAPHQHHLLALWRAIEARRYLVRATNTGLTAVVDPLGKTRRTLPTFTENFFVEEVRLLEIDTLYSTVGDLPAWILAAVTLLLALRPRRAAGNE